MKSFIYYFSLEIYDWRTIFKEALSVVSSDPPCKKGITNLWRKIWNLDLNVKNGVVFLALKMFNPDNFSISSRSRKKQDTMTVRKKLKIYLVRSVVFEVSSFLDNAVVKLLRVS